MLMTLKANNLFLVYMFSLAPDHVSSHNNLGTLLENDEVL